MHPENSHIKIIHEFPGHVSDIGVAAGIEKNRYKLVSDSQQNITYYMMDLHKTNEKLIFDVDDISKATSLYNPNFGMFQNQKQSKHPTWYKGQNGYAVCHGFKGTNGKISGVYFHHHVMDFKSENGKTIDHINQNPLDNRKSNLRIVNQSIQNNNQGFRKGKKEIIDIIQPNRNKNEDSNIKGLKTCFGWYDREHLFHKLPNYLEYRKADKKLGECFEVYTRMITKLDKNNGKQRTVSMKTTKSTELPILYKLREGLLIRHKIISENWDFKKGIFCIDGKQIHNIEELNNYSKQIVSYFTKENPDDIDLSKCKLKKPAYLADFYRLTQNLEKNHKYKPNRLWKRQERIDYLSNLFKSKTGQLLSNNGFNCLYKLVDKYYINNEKSNINSSIEHNEDIINYLIEDNQNYKQQDEIINMDIIRKRNRQKYDQSKYYNKKLDNENKVTNMEDEVKVIKMVTFKKKNEKYQSTNSKIYKSEAYKLAKEHATLLKTTGIIPKTSYPKDKIWHLDTRLYYLESLIETLLKDCYNENMYSITYQKLRKAVIEEYMLYDESNNDMVPLFNDYEPEPKIYIENEYSKTNEKDNYIINYALNFNDIGCHKKCKCNCLDDCDNNCKCDCDKYTNLEKLLSHYSK